VNDSALEEGYGISAGRSRNVLYSFARGGLASGVGGLRWFTGVLRDDFLAMRDDTTPSAYGG
jgi:hypothetical protein